MITRAMSHYKFLDLHFNTILTRMGRDDMIPRRGNFSASGDKYYSYKDKWEKQRICFFHGAAMYHLMELLFYKEVRETKQGWVDPCKWIIANYDDGHMLSQYMKGL